MELTEILLDNLIISYINRYNNVTHSSLPDYPNISQSYLIQANLLQGILLLAPDNALDKDSCNHLIVSDTGERLHHNSLLSYS